MNKLTIFGIAGSLRQNSYNKAVLKAATTLTPENVELQIFEKLGEIPLFNQDNEKNPPPAVISLKNQIKKADAVLIVTPEYNYSVPGVLKNAIDWASRPYGDNAWEEKPVAVMSASTGMLGGARAQYQLRQSFIFLNMFPLNKPEVIIPNTPEKFDKQGHLIDEHTKKKIKEQLLALTNWTLKLKGQPKSTKMPPQENFPYEYAYQQRMGNIHHQ